MPPFAEPTQVHKPVIRVFPFATAAPIRTMPRGEWQGYAVAQWRGSAAAGS